MTQITDAELAALLRMAAVVPAQTSPLARLQPAPADATIIASLASKDVVSPAGAIAADWHSVMVTLADPMIQASVHIEGAGTGQYFGGAGGIVGLQRGDEEHGVLAGLSVDAMLDDANVLLPWRPVSDPQPLRLDVSIEELTVLAATADAHREEQLIACIERRPLRGGAVTLEAIERLVASGLAHADYRWLVAVLNQFSASGGDPGPEQVQTGVRSLIGRQLAAADGDVLQLGQDLRAVATGLASTGPFLRLAVYAPSAYPDVKIFARGVQYFWGIEYGAERSLGARVSRLGGRAMESLLRQYLSPFDQYAVATAAQPRPPASAPPPPPSKAPRLPSGRPNGGSPASRPMPPPPPSQTRPQPPSRPAPAPPAGKICGTCGGELNPGQRFCASCGTPVTATVK